MRIKFLRDMVFCGKSYTAGSVAEFAESPDLRRCLSSKWLEVVPGKKTESSGSERILADAADGGADYMDGIRNDTI